MPKLNDWPAVAKGALIFVPYFAMGVIWEVYQDQLSPLTTNADWECIGVAGSTVAATYYFWRKKQDDRAEQNRLKEKRRAVTRPDFT